MSVKTADAPGPSPGANEIGRAGEARATARAASNHLRERVAGATAQHGGPVARASGSINQLIVVGTTLVIGVIVMASIIDAAPADAGVFNGTLDQITTILESSFLLAAILPLVIIAGAVLFYVRNFGGGGGGRGR